MPAVLLAHPCRKSHGLVSTSFNLLNKLATAKNLVSVNDFILTNTPSGD